MQRPVLAPAGTVEEMGGPPGLGGQEGLASRVDLRGMEEKHLSIWKRVKAEE